MATLSPHRLLQTRAHSPPSTFPVAVTSLAEYKSSIRNCSGPTIPSDPLTSDVTSLARRVLKESHNNQKLLRIYSQVANAPKSTSQSTNRQKKTTLSHKENRDRGRRRAKAKQKPKKKRSRRHRSESSSSSSSKSSFNSEEASSASSSS